MAGRPCRSCRRHPRDRRWRAWLWVASPAILHCGQTPIVLLADPLRDPQLVRAVQKAVEAVGGARLRPDGR